MNLSLKRFLGALTLALVLAMSLAHVPMVYSEEPKAQDKALSFLVDVVCLDITKYDAELVSYSVDYPSYLGGTARENVYYALYGVDESKLTVVCRFVNKLIVYFTLKVVEGAPLYAKAPFTSVLDTAKNLISRYQTFTEASYLQAMRDMLDPVNELRNATAIVDTVKQSISTGEHVQLRWMYTADDVDFPIKSTGFVFQNGHLRGFWDNWDLYRIGGTIAISREEAINIALECVKNYSLEIISGTDKIVVKLNIVDEPLNALLITGPREILTLYPAWTVQFYFDKVYYTYYGIQVRLWADTKQIIYCHPTGTGGDLTHVETSDITPTDPSLPVIPPPNSPMRPHSFLGSSLPAEYGYAIIVAIVMAIAGVTGYLYFKGKK